MRKLVWKHKSDDSPCVSVTRRKTDGAWLCNPHGRLVYMETVLVEADTVIQQPEVSGYTVGDLDAVLQSHLDGVLTPLESEPPLTETDHRTFQRIAEGNETWRVADRHIVLSKGETLTIPPFTDFERINPELRQDVVSREPLVMGPVYVVPTEPVLAGVKVFGPDGEVPSTWSLEGDTVRISLEPKHASGGSVATPATMAATRVAEDLDTPLAVAEELFERMVVQAISSEEQEEVAHLAIEQGGAVLRMVGWYCAGGHEVEGHDADAPASLRLDDPCSHGVPVFTVTKLP